MTFTRTHYGHRVYLETVGATVHVETRGTNATGRTFAVTVGYTHERGKSIVRTFTRAGGGYAALRRELQEAAAGRGRLLEQIQEAAAVAGLVVDPADGPCHKEEAS